MEKTSDKKVKADELLISLAQFVDDTFVAYFISNEAPVHWRKRLVSYESDQKSTLLKEGRTEEAAEEFILDQAHYIGNGICKVQTSTKRIRAILVPGYLENLQGKNAIITLCSYWEKLYRPKLIEYTGSTVEADIWGDLRLVRNSILHDKSIGNSNLVNLKILTMFLPGKEIIFDENIMEFIRDEIDKWSYDFYKFICESQFDDNESGK